MGVERSSDEIVRDIEQLCLDIRFSRKFDGQKFALFFSTTHFGTCGSIQTNEEKALDGALAILKGRLVEVLASAAPPPTPSSWMAL